MMRTKRGLINLSGYLKCVFNKKDKERREVHSCKTVTFKSILFRDSKKKVESQSRRKCELSINYLNNHLKQYNLIIKNCLFYGIGLSGE